MQKKKILFFILFVLTFISSVHFSEANSSVYTYQLHKDGEELKCEYPKCIYKEIKDLGEYYHQIYSRPNWETDTYNQKYTTCGPSSMVMGLDYYGLIDRENKGREKYVDDIYDYTNLNPISYRFYNPDDGRNLLSGTSTGATLNRKEILNLDSVVPVYTPAENEADFAWDQKEKDLFNAATEREQDWIAIKNSINNKWPVMRGGAIYPKIGDSLPAHYILIVGYLEYDKSKYTEDDDEYKYPYRIVVQDTYGWAGSGVTLKTYANGKTLDGNRRVYVFGDKDTKLKPNSDYKGAATRLTTIKGTNTSHLISNDAIYSYEVIEQEPTSQRFILNPGETKTVTVKIKNTGNVSWTGTGCGLVIRLGADYEKDRQSLFYDSQTWQDEKRMANIKYHRNENNEIDYFYFTFNLKAPNQAGLYTEYFRPLIEGEKWMQGENLKWEIEVIKNPEYQADLISQSVIKNNQSNAKVIQGYPGDKFTLLATYKNTGTQTWGQDTVLNLFNAEKFKCPDCKGWKNIIQIAMPQDRTEVLPNEQITFAFEIQIPTTTETGSFILQTSDMQNNGNKFFNYENPKWEIQVLNPNLEYGIIDGYFSEPQISSGSQIIYFENLEFSIQNLENNQTQIVKLNQPFYEIGLQSGNYKITPNKTDYIFNPPTQTIELIENQKIKLENFQPIYAPNVFKISGYAKEKNGTPITSAEVTLNSQQKVQTDSQGYYEFENLINGTYSLNIQKTGYDFLAIKKTEIPLANQDITDVDFWGATTELLPEPLILNHAGADFITNQADLILQGTVSLQANAVKIERDKHHFIAQSKIQTDGSFTYEVTLTEGENNFIITPVNIVNKEGKSKKIQVIYNPNFLENEVQQISWLYPSETEKIQGGTLQKANLIKLKLIPQDENGKIVQMIPKNLWEIYVNDNLILEPDLQIIEKDTFLEILFQAPSITVQGDYDLKIKIKDFEQTFENKIFYGNSPHPVQMAILIDVSKSMSGGRFLSSINVLKSLILNLQTQDNFTLLDFSDNQSAVSQNASWVPIFNEEMKVYFSNLFSQNFSNPDFEFNSNINLGLEEILKFNESNPNQKIKNAVLISDGLSLLNQSLLATIRAEGIHIFTVQVGNSTLGAQTLLALANQTGGEYLPKIFQTDLKRLYAQIKGENIDFNITQKSFSSIEKNTVRNLRIWVPKNTQTLKITTYWDAGLTPAGLPNPDLLEVKVENNLGFILENIEKNFIEYGGVRYLELIIPNPDALFYNIKISFPSNIAQNQSLFFQQTFALEVLDYEVTVALKAKTISNLSTDTRGDTDGDGLPDYWEEKYGYDAENNMTVIWDDDGDGVDTLTEYLEGTNPHDGDSDGDRVSDNLEIENGTSPTNFDDTLQNIPTRPIITTNNGQGFITENSSIQLEGNYSGTGFQVFGRLNQGEWQEIISEKTTWNFSKNLTETENLFEFQQINNQGIKSEITHLNVNFNQTQTDLALRILDSFWDATNTELIVNYQITNLSQIAGAGKLNVVQNMGDGVPLLDLYQGNTIFLAGKQTQTGTIIVDLSSLENQANFEFILKNTTPSDLDQSNNIQNITFQTLTRHLYLPDLNLSKTDINIPITDLNQIIPVTIQVHNQGKTTAENILVDIYKQTETGSILFKQETINSLASQKSTQISFNLPAENTKQEFKLVVKIDPQNNILEINEENNEAIQIVEIAPPQIFTQAEIDAILAGLNQPHFTDIEGHWAETEIMQMVEQGFIFGCTETKFCPESELSRAEFLEIIKTTYQKTERELWDENYYLRRWLDQECSYQNGKKECTLTLINPEKKVRKIETFPILFKLNQASFKQIILQTWFKEYFWHNPQKFFLLKPLTKAELCYLIINLSNE